MKQWEAMLADLNEKREKIRTDYQAKNAAIILLGHRLHTVFNDEAANYFFAPITPWSKKRLNATRQTATEITTTLTAQVEQQEFNHDQLGALLNELRRALSSTIAPGIRESLDPPMAQQGGSLLLTVKKAFDDGEEASAAEWDIHTKWQEDSEEKIFHQFLQEEPKAAAILQKMIAAPYGTSRKASSFGDATNPVTDDDMILLSEQLSLTLHEIATSNIMIWKRYEHKEEPSIGHTLTQFINRTKFSSTVESMKENPTENASLIYSLQGRARTLAAEYFSMKEKTLAFESPTP